jgi:hypothetical protein
VHIAEVIPNPIAIDRWPLRRQKADEREMARATAQIGSIDPDRCRASVAARYDIRVVAAAYEAVYRKAIESDPISQLSVARAKALP